ncbi:hypothetical protein ACWEQC_22195 [Streptomyces shenzhenensis]
MTAEMDIVVPVREGAANESLRYALRSWAANLPHRRVWLVGYRPPWATGVEHIRTHQAGKTKYKNTTAALRTVCEHPDVSETFLYCNDDFFVMRKQKIMPVFHRGPVREVEAYYATRGNGSYLRGLRETRDLLVSLGHTEPLSYELHVPLPVTKAGMLHALDIGGHLDVLHKRTAYGVLAGIGGTRMRDVKVLQRGPRFDTAGAFLSTMPDSFTNGTVGRHIRTSFRRPSPYETRRRR